MPTSPIGSAPRLRVASGAPRHDRQPALQALARPWSGRIGKMRAMPLYDYAPTSGACTKCDGRFEVTQRIAEPKLTHCPTCNQPCERLITSARVTGKYSTSDSRVKELGMTKYVKAGDGVYEKTTGTGPQVIVRK